MRLLDKTYLTRDEEYMPGSRIFSEIEAAVEALTLDTYNHEYVIRVTVDRVDPTGGDDET